MYFYLNYLLLKKIYNIVEILYKKLINLKTYFYLNYSLLEKINNID